MKIYLIISSLFFVGLALLVLAAIFASHRTRTGFIVSLGTWQLHVTWRKLTRAQSKPTAQPAKTLP
jgi:hypothetical protein